MKLNALYLVPTVLAAVQDRQATGLRPSRSRSPRSTGTHDLAGLSRDFKRRGWLSKDVADLLSERGFDALNEHQRARLLAGAVCANEFEMAESFLQKGVDVNGEDREFFTALHRAAEAGNEEAVEFLLKKVGANPNGGKYSRRFTTPLESALSVGPVWFTRPQAFNDPKTHTAYFELLSARAKVALRLLLAGATASRGALIDAKRALEGLQSLRLLDFVRQYGRATLEEAEKPKRDAELLFAVVVDMLEARNPPFTTF